MSVVPCVRQRQWGYLCIALLPAHYSSWLSVLPEQISGPLNSGISVEWTIFSFVIKLSNSSFCNPPSSCPLVSPVPEDEVSVLCVGWSFFFNMLFSASSQNRSKRKKGEELRNTGVNTVKSVGANRILLKMKRGWVEVDKKKSEIIVL